MPAWTEEASFAAATEGPAAARPGPAPAALSVAGVPWVTLSFLLACLWILVAAGGLRSGLSLGGLLAYGAKATPLILDRGETWRLLTANLLHKDILHLAFNAFAIWNVGGALERALRPADYLALLIFTALGTTVASAVGSDSISLGASGIAFGVLGASAAFGWRRGVQGSLRAHFGLRLVPWLIALFAAGLGSQGVDNWGHGGGLVVGAALGLLLTPRNWPGEAAAHRFAAAAGALLGTVSLGLFAAPFLPALGALHEGPGALQVRLPLGWRKVATGPDRVSYTNGLALSWRSSVSVVLGPPCTKNCCARAAGTIRSLIEDDLWHLADAGALNAFQLGNATPAPDGVRLEGVLTGSDAEMLVTAVCRQEGAAAAYVVAMQSPPNSAGSARLVDRVAEGMRPK